MKILRKTAITFLIFLIVFLILYFLFFPKYYSQYLDGGTKVYKAGLYTVVFWNRFDYKGVSVYWFPHNLNNNYEELWNSKNSKNSLRG